MMTGNAYGRTSDGTPIDDEMIARLADEAEREVEPGQLDGKRRGPGRPPLGDEVKVVESVRIDPGLRVEIAQRAAADGVTVSEVIRRALRDYLRSA